MKNRIALSATTALIAAGTALGAGGETPDTATPIASLPFTDMDTTEGKVNDRNEACPFTTDAPDLFYKFTPQENVTITIDLCASEYDTQVYVLDDAENRIACNDDACEDENEDPTLRSLLECVELEAGRTYFIGVDGGPGDPGPPELPDAGPYTLRVTECIPPDPWECPQGAAPEGEECVEDLPDSFNGGCNSPNRDAFSPIACGDVICGNGWGVFDVTARRDTDWYEIVTTEPTQFTLRGSFNFDVGVLGFILMSPGQEGTGNCDFVIGTDPFAIGETGEVVSVTTDFMPPGTHWFFVAPELGRIIPCPADPFEPTYWIELTCEEKRPPCPSDVNKDGIVGIQDIIKVLSDWGPCPE